MTIRRDYAEETAVPAEPVAYRRVEEPAAPVAYRPVEEGRAPTPWSPAQLIGLVVGVGMAVLGIVALNRTGFDTSHIYTPHRTIWHLPHSPLLAVIEIGFGALMILASVVPGALRTLMGLLGAAALVFGIVVLVGTTPNRLNHWLGVTHSSGVLYTIIGAVVVLAAFVSPVFFTGRRRAAA
jgi:hypothetical protein